MQRHANLQVLMCRVLCVVCIVWFVCFVVCVFLASSADDLSNKALYPYFSRTVGAARKSCAAMIDVVVSLGWREATMLFSEDTYGQGQSNSYQQAAKDLTVNNKTSVRFVNVLSFPTGNQQKLYNALTIVKESLTRSNVVFAGMTAKDYLLFLKLADQLGEQQIHRYINISRETHMI